MIERQQNTAAVVSHSVVLEPALWLRVWVTNSCTYILLFAVAAAAAASPGSASGPRALPSGPSKATTAPHPPAAPKGTTAGPRGGAVNFCAAMPPVVAYAACSLTGTKLVFAVGEVR